MANVQPLNRWLSVIDKEPINCDLSLGLHRIAYAVLVSK